MNPETQFPGSSTRPPIGRRRLVVFSLATIVIATTLSSIQEFWLEQVIYTHYGWPYDETLNEKIRFVLQAAVFTSAAIIGPTLLLLRSARQRDLVHKQLQTALATAQAANAAKSQFLTNMSHELRTPLNAVIGFADLMRTEPFGPLLPAYKEYAADIRNAGAHLLAVINDVLDISKAEAVGLSIRLSEVDLGEVFCEVRTLTAGPALNSSIALRFEMPNQAGPILVSADRTRLKQALINLISNGIKFNRPGGSVTVRAFSDVNIVRIEIRDTGIGMDPSRVAQAFQPFVQLHTGHARLYEGTGLGLPLTKLLIEAMRGSITVQSELGAGTCIILTLCCTVAVDIAHAA